MVVTTVAPDQTASWIAALPTAPAPPATRTVRPSRAPGPSRVASSPAERARWAVTAGTPSEAPRSYDAASGSGTTQAVGSTVCSAAVPPGRAHCARIVQTRSPTVSPSTPSPTASTTPAASWPGTTSSHGPFIALARNFQSVGFTPARTTRTRTSPGPGSGRGRSTTESTEEGPVWL